MWFIRELLEGGCCQRDFSMPGFVLQNKTYKTNCALWHLACEEVVNEFRAFSLKYKYKTQCATIEKHSRKHLESFPERANSPWLTIAFMCQKKTSFILNTLDYCICFSVPLYGQCFLISSSIGPFFSLFIIFSEFLWI